MSPRNRFAVILLVLVMGAFAYYWFSTDTSKDLVLIGTVDANQVVVSARVAGRIEKLTLQEGAEVKAGDVIAELDTAELQAQERAATETIASLEHKVQMTVAEEEQAKGETASAVTGAYARYEAARAELASAQADLDRLKQDDDRTLALASSGVASQQDKDRSQATLRAQQQKVQSLRDQIRSAQADIKTAEARTHQAHAAQSIVAATRADMRNAEAMKSQAAIRLGYTKIISPVNGIVSVRAAREGEVVQPGQAIVTVVDLTDTWVRVGIPETDADHIALGETLRIRTPGGSVTEGKVFFKAAEGDFATQRDVGRRKRDIKTLALKVRLDNSKKIFVPGMTAEVLVGPEKLK